MTLRKWGGLLALWSVTPWTTAALAQVRWRTGTSARSPSTRADVVSTIGAAALPGADRHLVIQLDRPVTPKVRRELEAGGVRLLSYLGNNAFFASVAEVAVDVAALQRVASLNDARPVLADFKLHPALAEGRTPTWAVVSAPQDSAAAGLESETWIGAYVLFHADVDRRSVEAVLLGNGVVIRQALRSVNGAVIELPLAMVDALASEDAVQYLEPALPRMSVVNDSNRSITEADAVQGAPYSLDGSGVTVMVYDGGTARASHDDFGGRCTVRDAGGMQFHATHVAGTIGGSGVASGGTYKGMAPGVGLESYGFEWDETGVVFYTNPGDIETDYDQAINTLGADIANNSIGSNVEMNLSDCAIQGDYGVTSTVIDSIVRGSLGASLRVVWSNGNERQGSRCDVEGFGDYYSTAPPAGAKNHITVGALNSNDDTMTGFSSWGPTDDGRLKPDVSAPGCQSNGDRGVTSTGHASDTSYITLCGTSMAAPTVTGLSALLLEDYRAQFVGQPDFRNSTLKALLAHNAQDLIDAGPDYQTGYGSVRIRQTIDFVRTGQFLEGAVDQSGSFARQATVDPGDPELKVTLAWDDPPGTPNVDPALVNDLDLRVTSPTGVRHYPWTLDPANPGSPAVRTQEDHTNNIEQVLVDNPGPGTWTIEVFGFNVPQGPQDFSLVGDGASNWEVSISFPNGLPATVSPGVSQVIDVRVAAVNEAVVPGSPTFHYRLAGGAYLTAALTPVGGDLYQATLPAANCGDTPEFYFSAEGSVSGVVFQPAAAPGDVLTAWVGQAVTVFADDFETDQGWMPGNLGASAGDWQRGIPINDPNWPYDPAADSDGSGSCWLTENDNNLSYPDPSDTDVDNGAVRLTSPTIDMSGGNITISYDYYLRLTDTAGGVDRLLVEIDGNGGAGPWFEVARHDLDGGSSWRSQVIDQAGLDAAGVTLTATTKVRLTANDADPQSIVESGLDALRVTSLSCAAPATCGDGIQNQGEGRIDCGGPCPPCECTADAQCSDGLFCDGAESCDAFGVCRPGADPCPGLNCDEPTQSCVVPAGEGFILSRNADYSTNDIDFSPTGVLYMIMWTDQVDFNDIVKLRWELKDNLGNKVRSPMTNHFDGSYTASFDLTGLPSAETSWRWSGRAQDSPGNRYRPRVWINVLPCGGSCDDGVGCTVDACDEVNDVCVYTASNGLCDNGLFCDGAEVCDGVNDCQPGADPCAVTEWCDETVNTCTPFGNGDFDGDGNVDLADFAEFQVCFGGLGIGGCAAGNLVGGDAVIDLNDFNAFMDVYTGP